LQPPEGPCTCAYVIFKKKNEKKKYKVIKIKNIKGNERSIKILQKLMQYKSLKQIQKLMQEAKQTPPAGQNFFCASAF